jgi:tetratricopeptide (TPR) repeat protein
MLGKIRTVLLQVINKLSKGNLSYERFLSAIEYEKRGEYDKAIEELSHVLRMDPHNNYAANWLAYSYLTIGEKEKAFNASSKASAPVKDMDESWYNLGNSYHGEKESDRAILCYEKALDINPRHADALINLGLIYDEYKGSLEKALELYKRAFEINANDFMLLSNMGSVLNRLGRSKEAIFYYERAIELEPQDFKLFLNLGIAQFNEGLFEEAARSFKKAISLDGEDARPHYCLGQLYLEVGSFKEGIIQLEEAASKGHDKARKELLELR